MITIRKATSSDIPLINRMAQLVFPDTYKEILSCEQLNYMMDMMYSPESLRSQLEEEGHLYYIAYHDEQAAGYLSVQREGEALFHLQKIYILPSYQGLQIGKQLFMKAIEIMKEIHPAPCRMQLNVNRHNKALAFYKHMGMSLLTAGDFPIGNGYYMNDYILILDI